MSLMSRAGAPKRALDGSILLACNQEGVWLWPGLSLTVRVGRTVCPRSKDTIFRAAVRFFGHEAHHSNLLQALEIASAAISKNDLTSAFAALSRSRLPNITRDGAALIRTVGDRLGVCAPMPTVVNGPRLWTETDVVAFAALYDQHILNARALECLFDRTRRSHPLSKYNENRRPGGEPDGGQYCSANDAGLPGDSILDGRPLQCIPSFVQPGRFQLREADGTPLEGSAPFKKPNGKTPCAALVQAVLHAPKTPFWAAGLNVSPETIDQIAPGTPLATFVDGEYPLNGRNMHTGLYAGHDDTGIFLLEQYDGVGVIHVRHYPWITSPRVGDSAWRIRSAINYSVVQWGASSEPAGVGR